MQESQVRSLVAELRSHMPHGVAKKKRKKGSEKKPPWEAVAAKENIDKILNQILQPYACPGQALVTVSHGSKPH